MLDLIIKAEVSLPLMEPTAVSISRQTCWRWNPEIDCSSCVEVSSKNNANRGTGRLSGFQTANMEQIHSLHTEMNAATRPQKQEMCK